jgi:hypothetical protein
MVLADFIHSVDIEFCFGELGRFSHCLRRGKKGTGEGKAVRNSIMHFVPCAAVWATLGILLRRSASVDHSQGQVVCFLLRVSTSLHAVARTLKISN